MIDGDAELSLNVVESAAQRGIDGGMARKRGGDAGPKKVAGKEPKRHADHGQ